MTIDELLKILPSCPPIRLLSVDDDVIDEAFSKGHIAYYMIKHFEPLRLLAIMETDSSKRSAFIRYNIYIGRKDADRIANVFSEMKEVLSSREGMNDDKGELEDYESKDEHA